MSNEARGTIAKESVNFSESHFNPASLRVEPNFSANLSAKKVHTHIPAHKPPSQEFIRVHPDESKHITVSILEWKEDREIYLVAPAIAEALGKEAKPRLLVPAITVAGTFFMWPIKLTSPGERENAWNLTALDAAKQAITKWVNISSNTIAAAYDTRVAEGLIKDPEWPDLTLQEMLKLTFRDRFIQDLDHPIVKKLKGVF